MLAQKRNMDNHRRKLILGTVQLGLPYGIANTTGQPSQEVADEIVRVAWEGGVRTFDTAQGYGESEAVLGRSFRRWNLANDAQIISKLSPVLKPKDSHELEASVRQSLANLGVASLAVLMFHREEHLSLLDGAVGHVLRQLRCKGLFHSFGVSVYTPAAALAALNHADVDVVQLPASVFDRRFEADGVFDLAERLGKTIHIRSALLQGVLCMAPDTLPERLASLASTLQNFHGVCARFGVAPAPAALGWLLQRHPKAYVLFGAETSEQVNINLDLPVAGEHFLCELCSELESCFPPQLSELLNPSLWKLK